MGKTEGLAAVGRLAIAFRQELTPETAALYAEKLADLQPELLQATVDRIIERSKFFPAISELRHCAASLAGLLPPSPAEALAIVRAADKSTPVFRRDGSFTGDTLREWDWPEDIDPKTLDLLRDTLERVGEPVNAEGETHFGWEMGFQKTYETQAVEIERLALADLSRATLPAHEQRRLPA